MYSIYLPFGQRYIAALIEARIEQIVIDINIEYAVDGRQRNVLHRGHLTLQQHLKRNLEQLPGVHLKLLAFYAVQIGEGVVVVARLFRLLILRANSLVGIRHRVTQKFG